MLSLNYLLLIFVSLWNSLEGTRVANNTNEGSKYITFVTVYFNSKEKTCFVLVWNNAFLDDPSLVSLFDFEGKSYYTPKLKVTILIWGISMVLGSFLSCYYLFNFRLLLLKPTSFVKILA